MINRYEAYKDGTALSSIDDRIIIVDIQHTPAKIDHRTGKVANRNGVRMYGDYYSEAAVTIFVEIHEYDTVKRQEICQKMAAWANYGDTLTVSDRPWQQLRCVCDEPPVIVSVKNWIAQVSMTFRAYTLPFWEEVNESVLTLTGTEGVGHLFVPGNVKDTLVRARIVANTSVSTIYLVSGDTFFYLSGLSLGSGDILTVDYDDNMILSIRENQFTSVLPYRSGSDDLKADSGKLNRFTMSANGSVNVDFLVRGWYV